MNIFNYEHQWPVVGYNEMLFSDFATAAVGEVITLPAGAQVTRGWVLVTTAYNSATTANLDVGDAASSTRYATDIDLKTTGLKAITPTGFITANKAPVTVTFGQTGAAATAGAARVYIEYVVERKSDIVSE